MQAPTLETPRLRLRPMREADFPAYAALMASPRARFMGGPYDIPGAWGNFCHDAGCWPLFGHGALMLERREDGVTVGQVGLNAGPLYPETELGWMLYDGHEGRGYATEGAARLRDWAWGTLPIETLVSYTHPDNDASKAVALRLGAVEDLDAPRQDPEDCVFRYRRAA
ncbi:GNAT family N-acetyltransferase [Roseicyclus sp.]|uniref:GNAT family N-acetyltransferase n=1 Tax=Roseicyclus sp. TaxID=1914329 RepID=UPI003F9F119D